MACGAFGCWIWFAFFRKSVRNSRWVEADDPSQSYAAFTKEFDVEASGSEIAEALESISPKRRTYSRSLTDTSWSSRIDAAEKAYAAAEVSALQPWLRANEEDAAITLLVDLSGSMGTKIVPLAGELRRICDAFSQAGIPAAMIGFTTVGWRGGQSRQKWSSAGSPSRPGRLCDLLHVTFKQFDQQFRDDDWQSMLHPGLLCENVDGEALQWAASLLKCRAETKKILVVLSDGAPVDDSTLIENGARFLERHIRSVIAELESDRALRLGAIGIGFAVDGYYANSSQLTEPDALSEKLATLLAILSD
ncbi:MAG: hypothetical protein WBL74_01505 [Novosphingobium sp.]